MISIISKIDGTSRKERYPVSIIVLASKVSDRRTKSEKRIRKLYRNIPYACRSKKVCNNSHALENNQEIRASICPHALEISMINRVSSYENTSRLSPSVSPIRQLHQRETLPQPYYDCS